MLETFTALSISIAPWAVSALMLYGLFYQSRRWQIEHHALIIGSAAYMGYVWLAALMASLQLLKLPVFSKWLLAFMVLSIFFCWGLGAFERSMAASAGLSQRQRQSSTNGGTRCLWWVTVALIIWLAFLTISVFWENALRPAVAWDTLTFWASDGHYFLLGQLNNSTLDAMSSRTHPVTIKYVGAWGAFALYERSAIGLYMPWAAIYLGNILVLSSLGKMLSGQWWPGLIASILMSSSPIVEAHASLGGYADLWITSSIVATFALLVASTRHELKPKLTMRLVIILLISSLIFLKGNTVVYAFLLISTMVFVWACIRWPWPATLALMVSLALSVLWVVINKGVDLSIAGYHLRFLPDLGQIALGQRHSVLARNSWAEITHNFLHVWGVNSSFLLAGILAVIICPLGLVKKALRQNWLVLTTVLFSIGVFVFFGVAQHYSTQVLFAYAGPESDTSLTRFSQVVYSIFVLAFLFILSSLVGSQNENNIKRPM